MQSSDGAEHLILESLAVQVRLLICDDEIVNLSSFKFVNLSG